MIVKVYMFFQGDDENVLKFDLVIIVNYVIILKIIELFVFNCEVYVYKYVYKDIF